MPSSGAGLVVSVPIRSKPDGYGKISQCITTAKHSKAKTVCIFLGVYYSVNALNSCCVDSKHQRRHLLYTHDSTHT